MVDFKISDKVKTLPLSDVKLGGCVAEQADVFFYERINSDFARNEIYAETERQFTIRDDDKYPIGMWRGEFWGKWVISACRVARYQNNAELLEFIRKGALNLISTADPDGYIGSYKNPENVLPCDPEEGVKIFGSPYDFNWNVWCRKYTLWGLIEAYQLTGDPDILAGAVNFTNQLISMLERLGITIAECGTFSGMPSGSILKPILILYRITGDKKYLDFALKIVEEWEREDGKMPNLIANALAMKPVHEWYPKPEVWAKAYEMMSCFDGIIELYRITGVQKYLTAAENMYELLRAHEENPVFSVGFNDMLSGGATIPNAISEPCDIIHWIRICTELYRVTGDMKYMNTVEFAFYNAFLASSFKDGKWGARGVRSVGRHMVANGQADMQYSHCCVNNIPRAFMNVAESFVMREGDGLTVNFYTDFEACSEIADIRIGGSYLRDGRVTLEIDAKRGFDLKLRIPEWCERTLVNGEAISPENGAYILPVTAGKSTVSLEFSMKIQLREMEQTPIHYPQSDYRIRRYSQENGVPEEIMTWDRRASLLYGPLLLTRSKFVGNTEEEMFGSDTVAHKGYSVEVKPIEHEGVNYAYEVSFTGDGKTVKTVMCDYASGTNVPSFDDDKLFNIYI